MQNRRCVVSLVGQLISIRNRREAQGHIGVHGRHSEVPSLWQTFPRAGVVYQTSVASRTAGKLFVRMLGNGKSLASVSEANNPAMTMIPHCDFAPYTPHRTNQHHKVSARKWGAIPCVRSSVQVKEEGEKSADLPAKGGNNAVGTVYLCSSTLCR